METRFDKAAQSNLQSAGWKKRLGPNAKKVLDTVLTKIEKEGPHKSRDFQNEKNVRAKWWGWTPSKTALEYHWRTGTLAVSARENFQKVYDIAGRVIPKDHQCKGFSDEEIIDWKCRSALERLGFGTPGDIARFWDTLSPKQVAEWAKSGAAKDLQEVTVVGADKEKKTALAFTTLNDELEALQEAPKPLRF